MPPAKCVGINMIAPATREFMVWLACDKNLTVFSVSDSDRMPISLLGLHAAVAFVRKI